MSEDLLVNETHVTGFKGKYKTGTKLPVDGDEIENLEAGALFYNTTLNRYFIYDGTTWHGTTLVTTSTSTSTSTSTTTSTS